MRFFLLICYLFFVSVGYCQCRVSNNLMQGNVAENRIDEDGIDAVMRIQKVADSLFFNKNYDESISLFKRIVRLNPENSHAKVKIEEINLLLVNLENSLSNTRVEKISTSDIILRAKNIQENRIDMNRNYYANRGAP